MDMVSARDQNIQLSVNNSDLQKQLELYVTVRFEIIIFIIMHNYLE